MGSYYADSFDLDLIRTEGRNLLTVIGGGGGGAFRGLQMAHSKRGSHHKNGFISS